MYHGINLPTQLPEGVGIQVVVVGGELFLVDNDKNVPVGVGTLISSCLRAENYDTGIAWNTAAPKLGRYEK